MVGAGLGPAEPTGPAINIGVIGVIGDRMESATNRTVGGGVRRDHKFTADMNEWLTLP